MPIDGCFVHYLTSELQDIVDAKINKIISPSKQEIVLSLYSKRVKKNLTINLTPGASFIYLNEANYTTFDEPSNFVMVLRKYIERTIIESIKQIQNDRIIVLKLNAASEFFADKTYLLIIELTGKNPNLILTKEDLEIIDSYRKYPPSDNSSKIILPHAIYPIEEASLNNPFDTDVAPFQGVAGMVLKNIGDVSINEFLSKPIIPCILKSGEKNDLYFQIIPGFEVEKEFESLSEAIDKYYHKYKITLNSKRSELLKKINAEEKRLNTKEAAILDDVKKASEALDKKNNAILLSSALYTLPEFAPSVVLYDYLEKNEDITIYLDESISVKDNMEKMFTKARKAKNTLEHAKVSLAEIEEERINLAEFRFQVEIASEAELAELNFAKANQTKKIKKIQPKINKIVLGDDLVIYIGKNAKQNDYITNKLSAKHDYWFHVKDAPGCHLLLKIPYKEYELNEEEIRLCANLATLFSKAKDSSSVPVDYTQVKNLKKIPGIEGNKLILKNQKTIYIDPDPALLSKYHLE